MSPIFDSRFREVRKKNTQPIFGFIIKIYITILKFYLGPFVVGGLHIIQMFSNYFIN